MKAVALSPMQRRVLVAMARDVTGFAAFTGERSRVAGFGVLEAEHGGIIIRAYSNPAYFLRQRGLIEPHTRKAPGRWYRLTKAGRAAIARNAAP